MKLGTSLEIDAASFETGAGSSEGSVATAVWAPPKAALSVPIDFAGLDVFEVHVHDQELGRLVAAIVLVSPANKDRPSHRQAFAVKCASYLQGGVSVLVIDIVTIRATNLHRELLQLLRLDTATAPSPPDLYAAAYRTLAIEGQWRLEAWLDALTLGAVLPTVPLWLSDECALPLNLEQSYLMTCETLRINYQELAGP